MLAVFTVVMLSATALLPRIAQPQSYHNFADQRPAPGIPNAGDVLSNAGFLLAGVMGLRFLWRERRAQDDRFLDRRLEQWPYVVMFCGLVLTGLGSSYYHLNPSDQTLVWDRLGMTVGLMGFLSAAICERIGTRLALRLLPVLLALSVTTVLYWRASELRGEGDLRWYGLAQAYGLLAVPLLLLVSRARYSMQWCWMAAIACYGAAKLLETFDRAVFGLTGHMVSGHSLKHLSAAAGGYFILSMLEKRRALAEATPPGWQK